LVAALNLLHFAAMSYPPYLRAVGAGTLGDVTGAWFVLSTLLLPIFVGFECWWMRNAAQSRALLIDAVFVIAWIAVFWGSIVFAFGHGAIP
jgi:hypothetical protein